MSEKDLHNLSQTYVELPHNQRALKSHLLNVGQQSSKRTFSGTFANFFKGNLTMNHITFAKPILVIGGIIASVLIGGTSYALLSGWPGVSTFLGNQTTAEDGSRIIKVSAQNCSLEYMDPTADKYVNPAAANTSDYYYKLKKSSQLSNEQIQQLVQGKCELSKQIEFEQTTGSAAIKANPANRDRIIYGGFIESVVKAFDAHGLTIETTVPMGDPQAAGSYTKKWLQTWPNVDPNSAVFYGEQRLSLADIKPGDHISIKYRVNDPTTRRSHDDKTDFNMDTSLFTVMYITKNMPSVTALIDLQQHNGQEIEQVYPCDKHENGFCSMQEHFGQ